MSFKRKGREVFIGDRTVGGTCPVGLTTLTPEGPDQAILRSSEGEQPRGPEDSEGQVLKSERVGFEERVKKVWNVES